MDRRKRALPGPAMVVAVLALVAAVAGTAIAGPTATTSVSKKQTKKIAKKQAKKQVNNVLPISSENLGDETVSASKLASISEESETTAVPAGTIGTATADCPAGSKVISGGYETGSNGVTTATASVESQRSNNGWTARAFAIGAADTLTARAYCLG